MSLQISSVDDSQPLATLEFPLSQCRLIEASAGTGKTYTIAVLYLRLILGHDRCSEAEPEPLMPPQILVATFTQAAADELRERIRARLHAAAQLFAAPDSSIPGDVDPLLLTLRGDYPNGQDRRIAAARLAKAADWMDEAAIFTIHGWCQRMLIEHAFHSRSLYAQTLLTDMTPVLETCVQDYWRIHVYALPESQQRLAARLLDDPERLLRRLRSLLVRDDTPIWLADRAVSHVDADLSAILACDTTHKSLLTRLESEARQIWQADESVLSELLTTLHPVINKRIHGVMKTERDLALVLERIASWAATGEALDPQIRAFLAGPSLNKGLVPPNHPIWSAVAAWHAAVRQTGELDEEMRLALFAHAALWVRHRVGVMLQMQGQMGFDDLLVNLDRALEGAAGHVLAKSLCRQFPVALIDEFQDTDPLQFRIFDRIYGITDEVPSGTVILIGDPKQSIYRFRGADIQSYLKARTATIGRHYTLGHNFRSTPGLVNAVNQVFSLAESRPGGAFGYRDGGGNALPFIPVAAKGRARTLRIDSQDAPPLTGWTLSGEPCGVSVFIDEMAARCATDICRRVQAGAGGQAVFYPSDSGVEVGGTALQPRDIAILVSNGKQAAAIQQALSQRGVRSVYLSDRHRLFASTEAADFLLWLRAMADPRHLGHIRSALATGSFCRSLAELDALRSTEAGEDPLDAAVERFLAYRALWLRQGVLAAVYRLLHDYDIPARLLTRPMVSVSGERRLMNLLHLADWAQSEQAQLAGIDALLQRFQQALDANETEQELRLEQDENLVQITTIHSAKGLQYPLVYLPYLCLIRPSERSRDDVAQVRHLGAERVLSLGADPQALAEQRHDELTEGLRLIYVGLTRAESACVVGLGPVTFNKKAAGTETETALGYLLGLSASSGDAPTARQGEVAPGQVPPRTLDEALTHWAACADIRIVAAPAATNDRYEAPVPLLGTALTPRIRHFRPWQITSFSSLSHSLHAALSVPETPEQANRLDSLVDESMEETTVWSSQSMAVDSTAVGPAHPTTVILSRLPKGPEFGTLMHRLFEVAGAEGFDRFDTRATCVTLFHADEGLETTPPEVREPLTELIAQALSVPLPTASGSLHLRGLRRYQIELEFWLPVDALRVAALDAILQAHFHPGLPRPPLSDQWVAGQLKGFMDLVFEADGRYYVLDYKSNWLGETDGAYAQERLTEAMLAARYDLQMALYLTALHRHLQDRVPDYDYARDMGGAFYLFVRGVAAPGCGVYSHCPDVAVIEAIDRCLGGEFEPPPGADPLAVLAMEAT